VKTKVKAAYDKIQRCSSSGDIFFWLFVMFINDCRIMVPFSQAGEKEKFSVMSDLVRRSVRKRIQKKIDRLARERLVKQNKDTFFGTEDNSIVDALQAAFQLYEKISRQKKAKNTSKPTSIEDKKNENDERFKVSFSFFLHLIYCCFEICLGFLFS
jgi:hypothetical protein